MFCFSVPAPVGEVFIEVKDQPVYTVSCAGPSLDLQDRDGITSRRRPNGAYTAYQQHWTLHAGVTQAFSATLTLVAIPRSHMSC